MQALTPEQAKMFWNAAGEIGKWTVSAVTLAALGWIGRTIKTLPDRIIAPVKEELSAHVLDDKKFQDEIRRHLRLPSPESDQAHQSTVRPIHTRHAHGD